MIDNNKVFAALLVDLSEALIMFVVASIVQDYMCLFLH